MPETMMSVLDDAVFSVREEGELGLERQASIPEILAALGSGTALSFTHLRAHQQHAWHAFLVQLAAILCHDSGETRLNRSGEEWRNAVLGLTYGDVEPWCLYVKDRTKPAFFQPPVKEGMWPDYKKTLDLPDLSQIDVLVVAKNHDVKEGRIGNPDPEDWAYALVTGQTMSGFSGRGNYGIARMNSGFGSRVCVAATPAIDSATRFAHDVGVWVAEREKILQAGIGFAASGGHRLLWCLAWDGVESLPVASLDPYFIEICRRYRLEPQGKGWAAHFATSDAARVNAKDRGGVLGDVWVPIKQGDSPTALTPSASGFSYRMMNDLLLSGTFKPSAAQALDPGAKRQWIVAQALVSGQGKTDGYHERWLPIPGPIVRMFTQRPDVLASMAAERVEIVDQCRQKILAPALGVLLQGAPDKVDLRDDRIGVWKWRLDERVDEVFFERLWRDVDGDYQDVQRAWRGEVLDFAEGILEEAIEEAPIAVARRPKIIAAAERRFYYRARDVFPMLFEQSEANGDEEEGADGAVED